MFLKAVIQIMRPSRRWRKHAGSQSWWPRLNLAGFQHTLTFSHHFVSLKHIYESILYCHTNEIKIISTVLIIVTVALNWTKAGWVYISTVGVYSSASRNSISSQKFWLEISTRFFKPKLLTRFSESKLPSRNFRVETWNLLLNWTTPHLSWVFTKPVKVKEISSSIVSWSKYPPSKQHESHKCNHFVVVSLVGNTQPAVWRNPESKPQRLQRPQSPKSST